MLDGLPLCLPAVDHAMLFCILVDGRARVPWISICEPSQTTQTGLFLQYLVRADAQGAYLCLGQGTSKLRTAAGPAVAAAHLSHIGAYVRHICQSILGEQAANFDLSGQIELRAPKGHGAPYEKPVLICRHYPAGGAAMETEVGTTAEHVRTNPSPSH